MGAVPVLIMLAAVGVDYGWQPDGTTSSRGDNVQYIIQIPPHQLDQIRSVGEITSTIDPSIQGRVTQIVVQIGSGPLPRDTGRALSHSATTAAAVAQAVALADDAAEIPIPEMAADSQAALASKAAGKPGLAAESGSESLMKPDPQGSGFQFPGGPQTPVRTNPDVSTEPAARNDAWDDISGRASTVRSGATTGTGSAASASVPPPSTDPVAPPTQPLAATPRASHADPLQMPAMASPGTSNLGAGGAGAAGNRPTDPNDPNWSGYGTTPNFGTLPPGLAAGAGITRPPADAPRADASYADVGSGAAAAERQRQATATQHTAAATGQPAAAMERYGRDSLGNALDQLGRAVDAHGRLIDAQSRQLVDDVGNLIDEYGRRIDKFGRLLPAEPAASTAPTGTAHLQPPSVPAQQAPAQRPTAADYAQPNGYAPGATATYNQPPYTPPTQGQSYPAPNPAGPANPAYSSTPYPSTPGYGQGNPPSAQHYNVAQGNPAAPTYPPPQAAPAAPNHYPSAPPANDARGDWRSQAARDFPRTGRSYDEDDFGSPSDSRRETPPTRGGSDAAALDRDLAAPLGAPAATRSRPVEAQRFFTFVLLISLVGNAYLIYETGNLRRKFRNMIASVRATKLAAQPANS